MIMCACYIFEIIKKKTIVKYLFFKSTTTVLIFEIKIRPPPFLKKKINKKKVLPDAIIRWNQNRWLILHNLSLYESDHLLKRCALLERL